MRRRGRSTLSLDIGERELAQSVGDRAGDSIHTESSPAAERFYFLCVRPLSRDLPANSLNLGSVGAALNSERALYQLNR